jgi:hypothetical protein
MWFLKGAVPVSTKVGEREKERERERERERDSYCPSICNIESAILCDPSGIFNNLKFCVIFRRF